MWQRKDSYATDFVLSITGSSGNLLYQASLTTAEANCSGFYCYVESTELGLSLSSGTHRWKVRAHNTAGYSEWSAELIFEVDATCPGKGKALSPVGGATVYTQRPTFEWQQEPNAGVYYLAVSGHGVFTNVPFACSAGRCWVTSEALGITLALGDHTWSVLPKKSDAGCSSGSSDEAAGAFTVAPPPVPAPPTLVAPVNWAITGRQPTFVWLPVPFATSYVLYDSPYPVGGPPQFTPHTVATSACSASECRASIGSYNCGARQLWKVQAIGDWGNPVESTTWVFDSGSLLTSGPRVIEPTGTIHSAFPTLSWYRLSGAERYSYTVRSLNPTVAKASDPSYACSTDICSVVLTSPNATALAAGAHQWEISGINDCGQQGPATTTPFTVQGPPAPEIPVDWAATTSRPTYRWKAVNEAEGYFIEVERYNEGYYTSLPPGKISVSLSACAGAECSFSFDSSQELACGYYRWNVSAVAGGLEGTVATREFRIGSGPPDPPGDVSIHPYLTDASIDWLASTGATTYAVDLLDANGQTMGHYEIDAASCGTRCYWGSSGLNEGSYYTWKVLARNDCGASAPYTYTFRTNER
jgi:hypothetical protein